MRIRNKRVEKRREGLLHSEVEVRSSMKLKGVFVGIALSAMLPFAALGAGSDRVVEIFTELSRVPRYSGNERGIGDWLIMYLYIWPGVVLITVILKKVVKEEFLVWAVVSGIFGLAFGLLCFPVYMVEFGPKVAAAKWVSGLVFDIPHGVFNFLIMLLLGKPVCKLLKKLKLIIRNY